tara:strand:+ start:13429 stop:13752 length:324 start_codon:yes stop_codon:yes gene_type:complete
MKALDLALLEAEVVSSNLSDQARDYLLLTIRRDRETRLELGREHLAMCQLITDRLDEERSLPYCIKVAAALHSLDEGSVRRIWRRFGQLSGQNTSPLHLLSVSESAS